MSDQKIPFEKPPLSLDEQVKLLVGRGLIVDDYDLAKHYLNFIGYYRLSGYSRYFANPVDEKHEVFRDGISFQRVLDLYIFDRKIRALLMDAFERIEIALKAVVSHEGSVLKGAFWLDDPANFDHGQHEAVLADVDEAVGRPGDGKTQHLFIAHFREKYSDPRPPSWMVFETMSFGAMSRTFKRCKGEIQSAIAKHFEVNRSVLESWMHALAFGRNVCAHNCRVWNRTFTIKPMQPNKWQPMLANVQPDRLYILCCIIRHLMRVISDGTQWPDRLKILISERGDLPLTSMGFPDGWENTEFWAEPMVT